MAGARTPEAMTPREIARLITAAGREPIERDTFYRTVHAGAWAGEAARR
jgi:aminodeoxyfutalosine synthase